MRKTFILLLLLTTLLAGAVLPGSAVAQQSTTKSQAAPAKPQSTPATAPDAPAPKPGAASPYTNPKDKWSYAIGMNIAASLQRQPLDLNLDVLTQAIKDSMGGKPQMTDEEAQAAIKQLQDAMRVKQEAAVESNKKEGEAFLAANKSKQGVVTLPSGLQYKIVKAGTGPKPAATDTVTVNYRGTLIDGKEFDASEKHGGPATFPVNGVIKGWTEALQLMPVGSKWQLFIPSDLAYGTRGAGGDIGPNSMLIFDVELLSIKPADAPADKK